MKALVLCGGVPQIALLKNLKSRGIETVLADMNESVKGRDYADKFYPVSVLDVEGIRDVAQKEKVDFVITVCADQVLQVVAEVSEMLGLPCYIDFKTAENVSKKSYMKKIFSENGIPTSKHVIMDVFDDEKVKDLKYPIIVKPIDSYSSRGVAKVFDIESLRSAFEVAINISRGKKAIVEEFVEGDEITVDIYVEDGIAHLLSISNSDKIGEGGKFVINRTRNPADVSESVVNKVKKVAQDIADAFGLKNTPMLIQLITDGENVSVIEFCARTGGGVKFRLIEKVSGFDVVDAVVELTLGNKPHVNPVRPPKKYITNEFLYCNEGVVDHLEGFEELLSEGVIREFAQFKPKWTKVGEIKSSGDRVAFFTIESENRDEMLKCHKIANERIKVIDENGVDILRHDLVARMK